MNRETGHLITRLAENDADRQAASRLRYAVFVEELGGRGEGVDHASRTESDRFDAYCDHLLLIDTRREKADQVVGVYRLMNSDGAEAAGQFYSEDEYDLTPLKTSGRKLLELGRSCVHRDYRGGMAMYLMWNALAGYVRDTGTEILFGVASFHGTDIAAAAQALSLLYHDHLAPPDLRVRAQPGVYQPMNLLGPETIDRRAAMKQVPQLIKAYLRLGGVIGDGAFIDHDFNTIDVCLIVDTARLNTRTASLYTEGRS